MEQSKFYQIKNITEQEYTLVGCDGSVITHPIQDVDKSASAFTIQDAEDGDVLCGYPNVDHPWIGIFCKLNDEGTFNSYCYLQAGEHGHFCPPSGENIFGKRNVDNHSLKDVVPATTEQRELLFQKMKEASYEWDAEKKELKKIEQKPAWSEEDELMLNDILTCGERHYHLDAENIFWLKSLKDRVQPQWKPSDEHMKLLREVQQALLSKDCHNRFVNFMCELKRLKEE